MKNTSIQILTLGLLAACGDSDDSLTHAANSLEGQVAIDGSSTVFPITEAVAEEYRSEAPRVRITVGVSGTGGGFKKFIAGETAISNASRYIKPIEIKACADAGHEFMELPVAYDGLAIAVHKSNTFATSMTVSELRLIWASDSVSKKWSDIRPEWPDREFHLFAPGQDSGTFDYFTETINGKSGNCRRDVTFSEDDNVLVRGIMGDEDGLAFFGLAYYVENAGKLNAVAVDPGNGEAVPPSAETVENGRYVPLSRPLFIYVSLKASKRAAVDHFVTYYLKNTAQLAGEVGYVSLPKEVSAGVMRRYAERVTGSLAGQEGTLEELYR